MPNELNFDVDNFNAFIPVWNKALTAIDCEQKEYEDFLLQIRHPISESIFNAMVLLRFKGYITSINQITFKRITRKQIEDQIMLDGEFKPCNEFVVEVNDYIELNDPPDNSKIEFTAIEKTTAPANQLYFSLSLFRAILKEYPTVQEFYFSIGKSTNPFSTWQEAILFKFMCPTGQLAYFDYSQDPPTRHLIKALLEYLSEE